MTDDDGALRARLAGADPARRPAVAGVVDAVTEQRIRERAMQTTTDTPPTARPRFGLIIGAAASVAAVALGVALAAGDSTSPAHDAAPTTLTLSAPRGDVMASCVAFDVAVLREMPVAFAGTVTALDADSVTLDVDHWYQGGTADVVTVANPATGMPVSIEGVEFAEGQRYLVTATDGTVNGCGFSGPATAGYERAFGEAFPG